MRNQQQRIKNIFTSSSRGGQSTKRLRITIRAPISLNPSTSHSQHTKHISTHHTHQIQTSKKTSTHPFHLDNKQRNFRSLPHARLSSATIQSNRSFSSPCGASSLLSTHLKSPPSIFNTKNSRIGGFVVRQFCNFRFVDKRSSTLKLPSQLKIPKKDNEPKLELEVQPQGEEKERDIFVDTSGLKRHDYAKKKSVSEKERRNKLVDMLIEDIKLRGPLSISQYLRHSLTNPQYGYYTAKNSSEVFGKRGDFITSPDISQMFGELLAIWTYLVQKQLVTKKFSLVEFGAGRATLLADILRIWRANFRKELLKMTIRIVERSSEMRKEQHKVLKCLEEEDLKNSDGMVVSSVTADGIPVKWGMVVEEVLEQVESDNEGFVGLAHEFFDALPIHQFQYTKDKGWLERLVDIDETDESPYHLRCVLSPGPTIASASLVKSIFKSAELSAEFRNSPNSPPRFEFDGVIAEACPEGREVVEKIAKTLQTPRRGAFLAIDYGKDHGFGDSLRAIKNHKFVEVFHDPGTSDLSSWVDFSALTHQIHHLNGAPGLSSDHKLTAFGPVTQRHFLEEMGIEVRLASLLVTASEDSQAEIIQGYRRLVGTEKDGMGQNYKVWAVSSPGVRLDGF